jgi:hypothetical protein
MAFNRTYGITNAKREQLDRMNSSALANSLGTELASCVKVVYGSYKYSRDGGAIGDYYLLDKDGARVYLPSGTIITDVLIHAATAGASGGSATIDLDSEAANDLLAAEAIASFSSNALVAGVPLAATGASTFVRLTAERALKMSINTAALTAGEFRVYVTCIVPGL